ncbi:CcdB family protein [Yersinia sp. 2540 StPb PI]|uniref:CcdB family protein n=1 Tax=unclassified Yersinia (in: enterobacteria) TaxID=2653513 RepID=UPI003B2850F0
MRSVALTVKRQQNTAKNKQSHHYFIDIKSDFINYFCTRLVTPLVRKQPVNSQVKVLSPVLTVDQMDYVILTSTYAKNLRSDNQVMGENHLRGELGRRLISLS